MHRVLDAVDAYVERTGRTAEFAPPQRPRRLCVPPATTALDLSRAGIGSVVVAAGYRPDYSWLRVPVTDPNGAIRQYRGVTPVDGLYVVGQRFQHRRDSGFIDGARRDAQAVVRHLLTGSTAVLSDEDSNESAA
jgi:putative flavoprotein involved in K+ transport